ncbi:hypothetical protein GGC65_004344 [Sphingopyxis sp. OAS728]|uniref:hypothetical protein n=1 Tax=Sphingopyxis sp. OAS728 TaxID=2663823 RepID=UPI001789591F|nr:hypothetical protein [Sphingopyxis sp. OAS728]MBE1529888.1 hypothetical protein [Sphingopyxis sp. OAS728]
MFAIKSLGAVSASALLLTATPLLAQSTTSEPSKDAQENRLGDIIGALFGDRLGASASIEGQWARGRKPLATQRTQFHSRIDTDVRSGALTNANGVRLKAEYDKLVDLEARYGSDNRFTTQERTELGDRYGALTQALSEGGYADEGSSNRLSVAEGRAEFERRVDAAAASRKISRTEASRLKRDYASLIQTEVTYARDGISEREQDDLDSRLDALDARVGDTGYGGSAPVLDNRTRLANIERALGSSGLSSSAQVQLRVELGDITRLEAAYGRTSPSSDDRSYLERRIVDLETRARVRR